MRKILGSTFLSVLLSFAVLTGCKDKKNDPTPTPATPAQSDQSGNTEADKAIDDVNDVISNKIGGGSNQRVAAYNLPCGVITLDSSSSNSNGKKIYKLNYGNQTPCGYKYKSGQVSFQLINGTAFGDSGATHLITFTDYVVETRATHETVKLNGTITVTNVKGGYIFQSVTQSKTIQHRIRGTFNITYTNGQVRERKYYQLRTWSSNNGWAGLTFSLAGDTTVNNLTISESGKTLDGNYDFVTEIMENFAWSNCGSTYAGPYVLKTGHARMDVTIPLVSPSYIDVEAGYYYDLASLSGSSMKDCMSNAYKISVVIGSNTKTTYQLY